MIYDTFLYNGEKHILNLRVHELYDVVDKFVVFESDTTFQGNPKPFFLNMDKDIPQKFHNKIQHIRYTPDVVKSNPWSNEEMQRNAIGKSLTNLYHNDIILLSDVDEIPDQTELQTIIQRGVNKPYTFYHNFYYFNVNVRSKRKWTGTHVFNYGNGELFNQGFNNIRQMGFHQKCFTPVNDTKNYSSGGWHFSNFGDADFIINKVESWSHTEVNKPEFKNKEYLQKCIKNGIDPFKSPDLFLEHIKETYLPKHVGVLPEEMRNEIDVTNTDH